MKHSLLTIIILTIALPSLGQSVVINRIFNGTGASGQYDTIELLVIQDNVDIRNWIIKDYSNNARNGTDGDWGAKYRFKDISLWKNLRSGTTITLRKGNTTGINPSPNTNYTEDTNASDFKIDLNLANTKYLRSLASPDLSPDPTYSHKDFILGGNEIILLRWDNGKGSGQGSENAVHAMSYGNVTASSHFTNISSPKLHSSSTIPDGSYLYPTTNNQNITDFSNISGVSKSPEPETYTPSPPNATSISSLLLTNSFVKTILSEQIVNNHTGLKEVYISFTDVNDRKQVIYVLDIDLSDPKISIELATPNDGFVDQGVQRVSAMIPIKNNNSINKIVLAAINGDYFGYTDGIARTNASTIKDGIIVRDYLSEGYKYFGKLNNRSYKIGHQADYLKLKPRFDELIGGRYHLIDNNTLVNSSDDARAPRTSIGLINEYRAIIIVNDGRQEDSNHSYGTTLPQLASLHQSLGAKDAINLDGGGSSVMIVRNLDGNYEIKNRPSDGSERSVANGLFVTRKTD